MSHVIFHPKLFEQLLKITLSKIVPFIHFPNLHHPFLCHWVARAYPSRCQAIPGYTLEGLPVHLIVTKTHTTTHIDRGGKFRVTSSPMIIILDSWRKPECLKKIHACMKSTWKSHTERNQPTLDPRAFLLSLSYYVYHYAVLEEILKVRQCFYDDLFKCT